ncbi:MAG: CapA family protein [Ignavibacteria bacterium]|nr:CapA family protein [Ignavibacteria bacterium]
MKKIFLIIASISFITFQGSQTELCGENSLFAEDSLKIVNLSFVGDIMCHTPQLEYAKVGRDSFDFRPYFSNVKKFLSAADLTFGNLETVIAGKSKKFSGYPLFNSPEQLLDALKDAGFDLLFTSNNHSLDRGTDGVVRTIQNIRNRNLLSIGTYLTEKERDSLLIVNSNGLKLGLLSYTYGLNGNYLPKEKSFMINVIDTNLIRNDLTKIQRSNPDLILVYFHFGEEYSRLPSKYQEEIVNKTFDYGADVIIGSHPHVIQPTKFVGKTNGKIKRGFVAYSLGNFISNQRWRYSDAGVILNIEIVKNTLKDSIWINKINAIPTWVYKGNVNGKNSFVILPSDTTLTGKLPEYLTKKDKEKLIESYNDTVEILFKK